MLEAAITFQVSICFNFLSCKILSTTLVPPSVPPSALERLKNLEKPLMQAIFSFIKDIKMIFKAA